MISWEIDGERLATFEANVDRSGGPDACHPWTAGRFPAGYGSFRLLGTNLGAHRIALGRKLGRDPRTVFARHSCDNPPCCNPAHLLDGDAASNGADCVARGRSRKGSQHNQAKLVEAQVLAIRARHATGESVSALARAFAVSRRTIRFIATRQTWRHV